jgi:transposase
MNEVKIGVDPHQLSATIEVVDEDATLLGSGRYGADNVGYQAMLRYVKAWPDRVWAVEGANGAGRPLAQRLVAAGERVVDVPAKLAAQVRLFDTGHNRKSDAVDAHSIAMVAVRTPGLRVISADGELEALRMLTDRRDELARQRVQTVNRLQRLLTELVPGHHKRDLSARQAKAILARIRPRDAAGKTRRRIAAEQIADLVTVDKKLKRMKAELKTGVADRGSSLMDVHGIGPVGAARILADVGDVARFPDRNRFASWTGTAPLEASSGEHVRHRLSRAGNRRMNHVLHVAAIAQIRHDTPGRAYYRRKLAAGKSPLEALRCLKRRLSDVVYRQLLADAREAEQPGAGADPGGHCGASLPSSAVDLPPHIDTSDQPQPGPAQPTLPEPRVGRTVPRPRQPALRDGASEPSRWSAPPDERP